MSVTIDSTPGSASANSFASEAEAIAYMAARLNASAWTTTTGSTLTENEKIALVEATREINNREYIGRRTDDTQALAWPRQWARNPDSSLFDYYATDEVPVRVKNACIELAFQFLKAGTADVAARDANDNIQTKTIDVLTTTYFKPEGHAKGLARYPRVFDYLRPLFCSYGGSAVVRG